MRQGEGRWQEAPVLGAICGPVEPLLSRVERPVYPEPAWGFIGAGARTRLCMIYLTPTSWARANQAWVRYNPLDLYEDLIKSKDYVVNTQSYKSGKR